MLVGRESECARIDELLERARLGRSGALVLRGEVGIGKTALLEYAAERADGMTVVRALGIESEAELDFSALLDASRPLLEYLADVPEQQAEALRTALGLGSIGSDRVAALDRFAIGAATLSLFAAAAEANPLLVVIDDAHWLDRASEDALLFATRRLAADRAVVLFSTRDGEGRTFEGPGIESIVLTGLRRKDAASLLRGQGEVSKEVSDRLYEATRGNPLALLELPSLLSPDQLKGHAAIEEPLPAGATVEQAFARRAEALSEGSQRALLVAAVSTSRTIELIVAALAFLGVPASSLEQAEDAGLLALVDWRLEFRHPLVRAAVYHAAAPSERRAAHRALAEACAETAREEKAWHLAAAALGPDEDVASALELIAEQARRRSGYAAAAAALERAARLSPDPRVRLERRAAAAEAAWHAGRTEEAAKLVAETLASADDPELRAKALRLHAAIEYLAGRGETAAVALLEATKLLELSDSDGAVAAAADAVTVLSRIREPTVAVETAEKARSLAPEDRGEADLNATLALGVALWIAGRHEEAEPHLRRAVQLAPAHTAIPGPLPVGQLASAFDWLGRYAQGYTHLSEAVERARSAGGAGAVAYLLGSPCWHALHGGRTNEAVADAGEALALADELGQTLTAMNALAVLTWAEALRGDEARCRAYGEEARRRADELGWPSKYRQLILTCLGVLELAAGRIHEAIGHFEQDLDVPAMPWMGLQVFTTQFELAEAYIRAGRVTDAEVTLARFEESRLAAIPFLCALARRCRGLLAVDTAFDSDFAKALELHERAECPFPLARTRLCYGERLRRAGRRVDAREQLRLALETFEHLGAATWAERARTEIRASGETLRRRDTFETEQLTPQELQIALQVAEGKTNKEVGAALFLSHKTVEFHLSRIFRKLDIHSRAELIRRFAASAEPVSELVAP